MNIPLRRVAKFLGQSVESDVLVTGWSVDTRTLVAGDVFFALHGPAHDGGDYIAQAFEKGAVAVVADRPADVAGTIFVVDDSLTALQTLASRVRDEWGGDVVAVTGSAGKTTTKDIVAEMLAEGTQVTKTEGNFNNHIGVPLSILRMNDAARVAVLEMGMNHAGEIRNLARIARPQVGVVTNVGYAHVEAFDSIDGVARAKRELIEELPENGTAVLNADDPRVAAFQEISKARMVLYGQSAGADIRAEAVEYREDGVRFRVGAAELETLLVGTHGVSNILAGIAVAGVYGISPDRLRERVKNLKPGKMRGEQSFHRGIRVFNDCYNSNPDAARAMIDVLRDTPARRRIAVLGEMLELGRWAEPLHREVGNYVAERGIHVLVGIRGAACHMLDAAIRAGLPADAAFFFEDPAEAGRLVRKLAQPGDAVLFKGSRGVHVERALDQFLVVSETGGSH
jgi:UDP-N-acetylmuramoyl-tripeptide--D-alanyl-D-alanine ligase